jgi:hypothetical protein
MKKAVFLLLIMLAFSGLAQAIAFDIVKSTRNAAGIPCGEIPKFLEQRYGFNKVRADWREKKLDHIVEVTLNVIASKNLAVDTMQMSYDFNGQWVWQVDRNNTVRPVNPAAKKWMGGKALNEG